MTFLRMSALGIAVLVLFLGCARTSSVDVTAEEQAIRQLDSLWVKAFIDKDIESAMRFFAPEAHLMPAHAPALVGQESIRAWFEAWLPNPAVTSTFAPEVIEVASSGDLAYDRGVYRFTMDTPEGRIEDSGKYLIVWKLIDGQWLAIVDISNSDLASPAIVAREESEKTGPDR